MASTTMTPGRTVRKIQPIPQARNCFELAISRATRWSFSPSPTHFWMQRVLIGAREIEFAGAQLRWGISGEPVAVEHLIWAPTTR